MGDTVSQTINGEICAECGVYLEPNQKVWAQHEEDQQSLKIPKDGSRVGFPVVCIDCR